jgi:hypothetical protein
MARRTHLRLHPRNDPHLEERMNERDEIDEIMARAMRLRSVEANKIITRPADIQRYIDECWTEELPAAQAARTALEAAGFEIVQAADAASEVPTDESLRPEELNSSNDE